MAQSAKLGAAAKITLAAALLILTGGAMSHAQSTFAVDFTWEGTAKCFDPKSPPFSLSGVPAATKVLKFAMKDVDAPNFPHGGGSVPYSGQTQVERGAFAYKGPCPLGVGDDDPPRQSEGRRSSSTE